MMKKKLLAMLAIVGCVASSARADLTSMISSMNTAITSGVGEIETVVTSTLVAVFAFILIFYAYKLIRRSIK